MRKLLLILILSTVHFSSCEQKKDYSKTLDEYYEFGLPQIDREWSYQDLQSAISSLEKLKETDSFPLPKLKSKKSSKYFKKILLELPKVDLSDSMNINHQFQNFDLFQKASSKLIFTYGVKEIEQIYYSNESIELEKLTIEEATKVAQLYFNFFAKQPDITNQLKESRLKLENGLFSIFEASLEAHENYNKYETGDKVALAKTIAANAPKIWDNLSSDYKIKLIDHIQLISQKNET